MNNTELTVTIPLDRYEELVVIEEKLRIVADLINRSDFKSMTDETILLILEGSFIKLPLVNEVNENE